MELRPRSQRRFTIAVAELSGENGWNAVFCTVHDLSDTGAKIQVPSNYRFPEKLFFRRAATGVTQKVRLVWRKYNTAGIEFLT